MMLRANWAPDDQVRVNNLKWRQAVSSWCTQILQRECAPRRPPAAPPVALCTPHPESKASPALQCPATYVSKMKNESALRRWASCQGKLNINACCPILALAFCKGHNWTAVTQLDRRPRFRCHVNAFSIACEGWCNAVLMSSRSSISLP